MQICSHKNMGETLNREKIVSSTDATAEEAKHESFDL